MYLLVKVLVNGTPQGFVKVLCVTPLSCLLYGFSNFSLKASIHLKSLSQHRWKNSLFKQTRSRPWTLNTFGRSLNMEGNLMRTETALRRPWLHSLYVVLMSTSVATVAVQIHANRKPVLCVARHRWLPLRQCVVANCDVLTAIVGDRNAEPTPHPRPPSLNWPCFQGSCWQVLQF